MQKVQFFFRKAWEKKAFSQNSEAPIQIRTEARATVFFNMTNLIS